MAENRILQVITRSDWGGAPRIVESLATRIDDVTAVACGPGGRLIERLERQNVPVHVQPHLRSAPHPADVLAYRDLKALIASGEFDLVHCHSTKAGALARLAANRLDVPTVFTVHGWGFYNTEYGALRPLVVRGERYLARKTEEVVCVSKHDRREGHKRDILEGDEGTVVHNGIPPLEPPKDRTTIEEAFGIDDEVPVLGAIARLAPQKDPLRILEVAKRLQHRGHEFAMVLIGSGPLQEECEDYVDRHGLERTYLPGFREDAKDLLHDFDVFLLPSRFEGFPLTVLECLHAGVPLVAHDVGGVAEAVDDGVTGFVVPPTADATFEDRVATLLDEPDRRRKMSVRSQQVARARFTEDRMVEEYSAVYERILR